MRAETWPTYIENVKGSRISSLASALADPTRASAVAALLSGTAHTSGELARACGVAPSTMSSHLSKLIDAGVVSVESAGRYRAYRMASREMAELLEHMDSIELPETVPPKRPSPGQGLSYARSCYDHIAGRLGTDLQDAFTERQWVVVENRVPSLTSEGESFMVDFGIDLDQLRQKRRPILRIDLDWTERRDHLAGSLPAAFMTQLIDQKWIRRRQDRRQLSVTEAGRAGLANVFGIVH